MTTQRERFEAWASSMTALPLGKVHSNKDARYVCDETDSSWIAWQEAERQAIERCAQVCKGLDNDGNSYEYRSAAVWCAERIRCLGADDAT